MDSSVSEILAASARLKSRMAADAALVGSIDRAVAQMRRSLATGGTIHTCGNGGSACDAMHFAEELVARYKRKRPGIRARHLLDAGIITCWANDEDFDTVFSRQVETLCGPDDCLVLFSTSGESVNLIRAVEAARLTSTASIGLLGKGGGTLLGLCDHSIIVPSQETERIQEAHITLVHVFCELLERPEPG